MRDLCPSAKQGRLCGDDLCHSGGETLCGFDLDFYREIAAEYEDNEPFYQQNDEEYESEPTFSSTTTTGEYEDCA